MDDLAFIIDGLVEQTLDDGVELVGFSASVGAQLLREGDLTAEQLVKALEVQCARYFSATTAHPGLLLYFWYDEIADALRGAAHPVVPLNGLPFGATLVSTSATELFAAALVGRDSIPWGELEELTLEEAFADDDEDDVEYTLGVFVVPPATAAR